MPFDPFYIVVALVFLTMVTVLVAAHELGHYLFARLFNMGVEEFAIGFGKKPIWTWMKKTYPVGEGETETTVFNVRPWPLGGFVRIKGMIPEEDGSEISVPGGFYSKPPWQRFIVLLAGPAFSILAGWVVLIPLFMVAGIPEADLRPIVGGVTQDGPAQKAGLKAGDRIISVDGSPVGKFYDVIVKVRDHGPAPIQLIVERKGAEVPISVTPIQDKEPMAVLSSKLEPTSEKRIQWKLGMAPGSRRVPASFGLAVTKAVALPGVMIQSLAGIVAKPSRFKDEVGGPASMVAVTAQSAKSGLAEVLFVVGALSISLGIFNLLPVTPLDGGQMVVAFAEMLRRGRRLSFKVQNWVAGLGFTLVLMLIVSVLAVDFNRFFPFGSKEKSAATQTEKK